jgi:hypothetical protein
VNKYFIEKGLNEEDAVNAAEYQFKNISNYKFAAALTRNLIEKGNKDYDVKIMNYKCEKILNRTILSESLAEINKEFPDSTFVKEEYNNSKLITNINSTSFIKRYPVGQYIKEIMPDTNDNLSKAVLTYIVSAEILYENGEIEEADKYRGLAHEVVVEKPDLLSNEYFERFLFINCKLNLLYDREPEFFSDLRTLLDYFPFNKEIEILSRMYLLKKEKEAKLLREE